MHSNKGQITIMIVDNGFVVDGWLPPKKDPNSAAETVISGVQAQMQAANEDPELQKLQNQESALERMRQEYAPTHALRIIEKKEDVLAFIQQFIPEQKKGVRLEG